MCFSLFLVIFIIVLSCFLCFFIFLKMFIDFFLIFGVWRLIVFWFFSGDNFVECNCFDEGIEVSCEGFVEECSNDLGCFVVYGNGNI